MLHELYPVLVKNTLKNTNFLHKTDKYSHLKSLHQSIQDAVLTLVSWKHIPETSRSLLQEK